MSLHRRFLLNREVQSSDNATRIVELPRQGRLSAIGLRFEGTNGATSGTEELRDAIDRIEVIANGSEVLFSLEGVEFERWQYIYLRRSSPKVRSMAVAGVQELFGLIPFGRKLGDPELYLDLGRYQRVELRVQYSPTISATTFATGTFTISAILYEFPAEAAYARTRGYIRTTQVRAFTSAASGEDVFELPNRYPHLGYLAYAREAAIADGVDISLVEVREDDGRVIPYTGRWQDIRAENQEMFDIQSVEQGIALRTDNETIDTLVQPISALALTVVEDGIATDPVVPSVTPATIAADRVTLSIVESDEDATQAASALASALYTVHWEAKGLGIGNAVFVPMSNWQDLETAYPAPAKAKVQLALTQAGAGATVRVSIAELVPGG